MNTQRTDPTGKRALFGPPGGEAASAVRPAPNTGKAALFSTTPRRLGTVIIECSHCGTRSRSSVVDLGVRLLTGSAWLPLGRYQHWMRCPACGGHHWCRVGWTE